MSRVKQAGKRARTDPNAPQPPLRLTQTPVERWFEEKNEVTDFDDRLSKMEILTPKYIGDGALPDAKYYPCFVPAASTTIFIRENENEGEGFVLGFRLGGREFKFTLEVLAAAWGLRNGGDTFKGGNYPLGT
ncbi:hypothetical protein PIB30_056547 [Stylosanthes scabra]|uniref:Uncharacterized protein n=1 Tax=Stylosanthes scabra TaxID=79078 RepID=A0ABU6VMJ5_9FABA|nr:hypothetical protein [Stylosanthes scabra]